MELRHANHCIYKIRYHMVFCMKYRKNLLNNYAVNFLKHVCSDIGERYSFEFDAIGCDGDHVHLFVGAEPKYSPSRVMQIIKNITARNIFKEYPEIKKQIWGGELWRIHWNSWRRKYFRCYNKICSESGRSGRKASI